MPLYFKKRDIFLTQVERKCQELREAMFWFLHHHIVLHSIGNSFLCLHAFCFSSNSS